MWFGNQLIADTAIKGFSEKAGKLSVGDAYILRMAWYFGKPLLRAPEYRASALNEAFFHFGIAVRTFHIQHLRFV